MKKKAVLSKNKNASRICIIGPGVVGQAQGKAFAQFGYVTEFLGGNAEKRERLRAEGYTTHDKGALFSGDYDFDISFLTVPTPTVNGEINLDFIKSAASDLGKRLSARKNQKYHLAVVKSTVPPGTTEELIIKEIEESSGLKAGQDFGVCMNPEYLREATAFEDALKPWVILVGELDERSGDLLCEVYEKFNVRIVRGTLREAEMQKYVHNLFNAVKISFFNEMREIAESIGADPAKIFDVTTQSSEGMWNSKYGTKNHGPFMGSCLPKDTQAFYKWAQAKGLNASLLQEAINVNNSLLRRNGHVDENIEVGTNL